MGLTIGTQLGSPEIIALLGKGGILWIRRPWSLVDGRHGVYSRRFGMV